MTIDHVVNRSFYPLYVAWSKAKGLKVLPFSILPELGFVASYQEKVIAGAWVAMFLHMPIYQVLFLTVDPGLSVIFRARALQFLLTEIATIMSDAHDYRTAMILGGREDYNTLLTKLGYDVLDDNLTLFFKAHGGN